ncbi:MAG: hypothetical protein ACTS7E_01055 [Arsenophonus sp. NC-CH8-MAG3]
MRHILDGISAFYAVLKGINKNLARIKISHIQIHGIEECKNVNAKVQTDIQYQLVITERLIIWYYSICFVEWVIIMGQ